MGNFRTDDDDSSNNVNSYPVDTGYDNPEMGNHPGGYGSIKKPNIISRLFSALGNIGSGVGIKKGITLERVLLILYLIAMVFVVINITAVLDFLFYATASVLQYVIMILVVVLLGYIFCGYVLHIR